MYEIILWLALMVVLCVIEAGTVNLVSIWFAIGALAALIAAALGGPFWLQVVLFVAVSAAALVLTRPLVKKRLASKPEATNADAVFEQPATVTERIDNNQAVGTVSVGGKLWTARSEDCVPIEAGTRVRVVSIQGVKLIVKPL